MIYDLNGNELQEAYDKNSGELLSAYDYRGEEIWASGSFITLKFMTYNVQGWSGMNSNTPVITDMFERYSPVVVGLQECGSNGGYVPSVFPYDYKSSGITNPIMVFVENAISDITTTVYSVTARETRGYQKFTMQIGGKSVTIINTHVETLGNTEAHFAQLSELLSVLAEEETFVALGDFNLELHSKADREYTDFVKPLIDAGYHLSNWSDETGFVDTWFNGSTIAGSTYKCPCDNIITSPDIEILEIVYDTSKIIAGSTSPIDHIPVISTLRFKEDTP